jgi:hypothetical protein
MLFYIYEVPGIKNGATHDWPTRRLYNFNQYQIEPIIIETMEGPDNEDMWQIVGDREWELADLNGYDKGSHYIEMRRRAIKGGLANNKTGHMDRMRDLSTTPEAIAKRKTTWKQNNNTVKFTNEHRRAVCRKYRKLTFEQAEEIRAKYIPRKYTAKMLSEDYKVNISLIKGIISNTIYKQA